jgi:PBP1b-binding outer membrane lipoprotein LpoB
MKKIYLIISLMILLVTSCSDFLDTYPKDALSPSTTWQTEDDAEKFLVGL